MSCQAEGSASLSGSLWEAAGVHCFSSLLLNLPSAKLQKIPRPPENHCLLEFDNIGFSQEFIPAKSVFFIHGFLFLFFSYFLKSP